MPSLTNAALTAHERRLWRCVFALIAFVFFGCYPYLARMNNPNENVRAYMSMALVEQHHFHIDEQVKTYGWVNDMARVPQPDGSAKFYSVKSPGVSLTAVPAYAVYRKVAPLLGLRSDDAHTRGAYFRGAVFAMRAFAVALPNFIFLIMFERLLRRYVNDVQTRLLAVVAVAFGSNFLAYTLTLASHALFASCSFAAFGLWAEEWLRVKEEQLRPRASRALMVGFFTAAITTTDYQGFPLSALFALAAMLVFWRLRDLALLAAGAALPTAAVMLFHARSFGSPFTPGHKFCENPEFASKHAAGLYGIGAHVDMKVFMNLSFHPTYGFFSTAPYMLLGLVAALPLYVWPTRTASPRWPRRVVLAVGALGMLMLWAALSAANNWRGGWAVGPRLLGAAPPFFAFAAAWGVSRLAEKWALSKSWLGAMGVGLVLVGAARTGLVSMMYPSIPEDVSRPVEQLVWPLLRAGYVPHTIGELVGAPHVGFLLMLFCLVAAPLCVARPGLGKGLSRFGPPTAGIAVGLLSGLLIVNAPLPESERHYDGVGALHFFESIWEPERK